MIAASIVPWQGMHDAFRVVAAAAWYADWRERLLASERPLPVAHPYALESGPAEILNEHTAKSALATCGLRVPPGRVVSLQKVPTAATALGFPVVVKALHAGLPHKTEAGGVAVGITSALAADAAARRRFRRPRRPRNQGGAVS